MSFIDSDSLDSFTHIELSDSWKNLQQQDELSPSKSKNNNNKIVIIK